LSKSKPIRGLHYCGAAASSETRNSTDSRHGVNTRCKRFFAGPRELPQLIATMMVMTTEFHCTSAHLGSSGKYLRTPHFPWGMKQKLVPFLWSAAVHCRFLFWSAAIYRRFSFSPQAAGDLPQNVARQPSNLSPESGDESPHSKRQRETPEMPQPRFGRVSGESAANSPQGRVLCDVCGEFSGVSSNPSGGGKELPGEFWALGLHFSEFPRK